MLFRLLVLLTSLAAGVLAAAAQGPFEGTRPPHIASHAPLSGEAAARSTGFVTAMLRYRHVAAERAWKPGPYPIVGHEALSRAPFIWIAGDGSHVERVGQGWFRVTPAAGSGLFRSIDCRVQEWPTFRCSDGQQRSMSVPSDTTLIFGNVQFERQRPDGTSR